MCLAADDVAARGTSGTRWAALWVTFFLHPLLERRSFGCRIFVLCVTVGDSLRVVIYEETDTWCLALMALL